MTVRSSRTDALHAHAVTGDPVGVRALQAAVAAALAGGPAVAPLPAEPALVRASVTAVLRPDLPLDDEDGADPVAVVVPTAGSAGEPKGVLLGAAALRASAAAVETRLGGSGRWLLALPVTGIGGLGVLVRSVLAGTDPVTLDLRSGFDPAAFVDATARLAGSSRRYVSLVPTQLHRLAAAGGAAVDALASYDAVLVGGAAVPPALLARLRADGVVVVPTYGCTETCGGCVYDGRPLDGVTVRVGADGRVGVAGPVLARGYRLRPDLTAAAFRDGWYETADRGTWLPAERVAVLGRLDDVVLTGGVSVPLAAVEEAVAGAPGVAEVAAVGLPDPQWGQRVAVAVVPRDPADPPTLGAIRAHVRSRAPAAYAPGRLVVVTALPLLPGGKVDRTGLADLFGEAS